MIFAPQQAFRLIYRTSLYLWYIKRLIGSHFAHHVAIKQ